MLREVLVLVAAALAPHIASASTEAIAAESFRAFVASASSATDARTDVSFVPATGKFYKSQYRIRNVEFDITRTDSLVSPLLGLVTFELSSLSSTGEPTEEAATIATTSLSASSDGRKIRLNYAFQSGRWVFRSGTFTSPLLNNQRFSLNPGALKDQPFRQPDLGLKHWYIGLE